MKAAVTALADVPAVAGEWLPLTAAQQGLWFAHQLAPENPGCTTAEVVELVGPVDHGRLEAALNRTYAAHEQCRVVVRPGADGPRQQVQPPTWRRLPELVLGSDDEAEQWMADDLAVAMDLEAGDVVRSALLRLPDGPDGPRAWWYHAAHHVVLDGYGAQQLLRATAAAYLGEDEPVGVALADLVAEDSRLQAEVDHGPWQERVGAYAGQSSPAGRRATAAPRSLRVATTLAPALHRGFKQGARRLGVAWGDLLVAAVGTYVGRMAGLGRVRVGVPLMNRSLPGHGALSAARTVCTAMNVLPVEVVADGSVAEALASVTAGQAWLREHPFVRHEALARRLSATSDAQLFGPQVNLVPFDLRLELGPETQGQVRNLASGPVEDLTVCLRGTPGRPGDVRLEVEANPRLHRADELDGHLARVVHWLGQVAEAAADDAVAGLQLLPADEHDLVVRRFNATERPRRPATLAERFLTGADLDPDATALVCGRTTRSYRELLDAARRVAAGLAGEGVRPGDVVGVQLERGARLLEVVHGVVLAGAVYLPLDPDLPVERRAAVLEDAAAVRVVTGDDVPDADPTGTGALAAVAEAVGVGDPAYLLFTSGSTGRPKGVLVSHRAIDNRLAWQQHHLGIGPGDRVLHKTPISFDVSVWELFWAFQQGATLVVSPPGEHRDPRALARRVVDDRVDVLHFVPSMLRAFLADPAARALVRTGRVRAVVTSGEALTPDLVSGCREWFGVPPTNLYGPTEAAVDVTVWDCDADEEVVPIGRPVWNTRCYVLDDAMSPVPVGAVGELWLGGVQLAEGYVGRPDLTAERFLPDPFLAGDGRVERVYRTGDLAAWRGDGALRYLGRTDDQVKVRGQRVELGEVEAVVARTPGVVGVVAGTVEDADRSGSASLVVWYVLAPGDAKGVGGSEEILDADLVPALLATVRRHLPEAWLPHHWVRVPAIPVGSTGKADRRALLAEHPPRVRARAGGSAPTGLDEERWCRLVASVLGVDEVGTADDFFALGGDSLRVLGLVAAAQEEFGVEVSLADVFAEPTPSGLARLTAGGGTQRLHPDVLTLRRGSASVAETGAEPPPLFLLPPAGGLGWCYTGLLQGLPAGVAVHALQAPGIESGTPEPVADLAELVARQYAAVRAVVGDAPFHVAGWSLGGMAAHGVATLARGAGQEVCSVTLLDAYPCDQWRHLPVPDESTALAGVLRLGGQEPPAGTLTRDRAVALLQSGGSAVASLPTRVLEGCVTAVVEAAGVVRTSHHEVLAGDLTVVVASAPRTEDWLDADGWRPYVGGTVAVEPVAATHGELLRAPAVEQVAELLARHWR